MKRTAPMLAILAAVAAAIGYYSYGQNNLYQRYAEMRVDWAETSDGPIDIAIVWPFADKTHFLDGVQFAVDDVNVKGIFGGRRLVPTYFNEENPDTSADVAEKIGRTPRFMAVIGHVASETAISASVTYEYFGILFIAPFASDPSLTSHRFQHVLRVIPPAQESCRCLALFAARAGFKKVGILFNRDGYKGLYAAMFLYFGDPEGIKASFVSSYGSECRDFRPLLADARSTDMDAMLVLDSLPLAAKVIKQARQMGITQPLMGGHEIDSPNLWRLAGAAADGTYVPTIFDPTAGGSDLEMGFSRRFRTRFGHYPDLAASLGYEAVSVYAQAVERTHSTMPLVVATTLYHEGPFHGVGEDMSFTAYGDPVGREIFVKVVKRGHFEIVPGSETRTVPWEPESQTQSAVLRDSTQPDEGD
ncbi:MAG: ABC transporter substrate-binding protein [Acidobacteriota bacterium]